MPARLSIQRPAPTTVLFTVSNAPSRSTVTSKLLFYLELFLRISVFAAVLLIDAAKLREHVFYRDGYIPWTSVWSSPVGTFACHIADRHVWHVVAPISAVLLYLMSRKGHTGASEMAEFTSLCNTNDTLQRGIVARNSRPWNPDIYFRGNILHECYDTIHTHDANTRYCDP